LSRMRPRARAVLACAAAAGLVAGCGSTSNPPDLLSTLPSPAATVPPPTPANVAGPGFRPIGGDEFNAGSLNMRKWGPYDSVGGFGYGLRRPSAISVSGGSLVITATGNTSGGMADSVGQLYGRWEFRARTDPGRGFGSAILLWPDSEKLSDGEIDIAEVPDETRNVVNYVLHSGYDGNTLDGWHVPGDFTQWHTFAVDWLPNQITWFVDGTAVYQVTNRARIPDTPMHLAIQLDEGPVPDWILPPDATTPPQIRLQVDWVHEFALATARPPARAPAPAAPAPAAPAPAAPAHAAPAHAAPAHPTTAPTTTARPTTARAATAPAVTAPAAKPSPTKKPSDD
jgi:Glycosyl hydrolases family 16